MFQFQMADVSHGGDGGDESPRRQSKGKRSRCESESQPNRNQLKKTRSYSTGQNLQKAWIRNEMKKLPIEFDLTGSFAPIGPNYGLYVRAIGNKIREVVIPYHTGWASVPEEQQKKVFRRVKKYFNLRGNLKRGDSNYKRILKSFDRTAADRFSGYKSAAHTYYKAQQKDPEKYPGNYMGMSDVDWQKCKDLFNSEAYKNRSKTNSNNRKKHKYPCYQGSKSLIAHMEDWKREEEEKEKDDDDDDVDDREEVGDVPSFIEIFRKKHTDKNTGKWVNKEAESDYFRLIVAREDFIVANPGKIMDVMAERAIMREVFGEKRGHECGYGMILKGSKSATIHDIPESSCASAETCEDPRFAFLIKKIEDLSKEVAELKSKARINDDGEEAYVDADEHGQSLR